MACDVRKVNDDWRFWKSKTRPEFGIGPIRWLNNIHKARCVLTDSFHATVFSVLLQKDFVVSLANAHKGKSNRIVSFLSDLGLESRIMSDEDKLQDVRARMHAPVDWQAVGNRIARMGARSLRFLESALAPASGSGCRI
jgi:exopolysaccharide biosynthesis predicted pyruvyltransferase EpsI